MKKDRKVTVGVLVALLVLAGIPLAAGLSATASPDVGSFALPFGIQYEQASGYVYVADSYRNCIIRTRMDGSGWSTFGSFGRGRNQFCAPKGLYVDSAGYLYVADAANNRIVKTRMDGSYWATLGGLRGMGQGQFAGPRGIVADEASGDVYVADSGNNRIVKTKMDGSGWTTWGRQGTGPGQFYLPTGVDYDPAGGNLYVTDAANCRLVTGKIDGSGWKVFGSAGSGQGRFRGPRGIKLQADGTLLVTDTANCRVVMTNMDGTVWQVLGSRGYGVGQFANPRSVTVDASGNLYITDWSNHRVVKTKLNGEGWQSLSARYAENLGISYIEPPTGSPGDEVKIYGIGFGASQGTSHVLFNGVEAQVKSWAATVINAIVPERARTGDVKVVVGGEQTNGVFFNITGRDSLFKWPFGVAYEPDTDTVYVSDTRHHRLVQANMDGQNFAAFGTPGFGDGQFALPKGLYYSKAEGGYLYTTDSVNNRLVRTKMTGEGWQTLGTQGAGDRELYFPRNVFRDDTAGYLYIADAGNNRIVRTKMDGSEWVALGTWGYGKGQFFEPSGITYDPATGLVYVADSLNCRIVRTKMDGSGWETFATYGQGAGQLRAPRSIFLDQPTGTLYIADTDNHRIVKTAFGGAGWQSLGSLGPGQGQFYYPRGIWYDPESGQIFVADSGNNRIVSTSIDGSNWKVLSGGPSIPFTWNLAEGTTRKGFDEYLCLLNPGNDTAKVTVTTQLPRGSGPNKTITIAPRTRETLDARAIVGDEKDVALRVESNRPLIAERPVYFNRDGITGAHDNLGRPDPSTSFYFAEGTTRDGFKEWLTLQNPGGRAANVALKFMLESGANKNLKVTLEGHSRQTIKVSDVIGEDKDVSVAISSSAPIVAERPMYFRYKNKWAGGHVSSGVVMPENRFYFAEGTTRNGFDEYLCLMNPGGRTASVTITYMLADGTTVTRKVTVGPRSRKTVDVAAQVGRGKDVSAQVQSNIPIVAERPVYFSYGAGGWTGGHNGVGVDQPATTYYFAEGATREGFDEWLTIMNPGNSTAHIKLTYMFGRNQGSPIVQRTTVGAHSRLTVDVAAAVGCGKDVSIKLESSVPVVAERPLYFNYKGEIKSGHCAVGFGI